METAKRQVTIIDELLDNEQLKRNRRMYDEHERSLQRENIQLKERLKKMENLSKDHEKEFLKRALAKQAADYQKLIASKDKEIEELAKSNPLHLALRQSNIEKLHLEKRLLSSSSSFNSTTTASNAVPLNNESGTPTESNASTATPLIDFNQYQALQKSNEILKAEVHRLASAVEENTSQLSNKLQQYDQLEESYKHLLEVEQRFKSIQTAHDLSMKDIERLHNDLQSCIKERDNALTSNDQLRTEMNNLIATNERVNDECDKLRTALIAKSDQFDLKQRENEQLQNLLTSGQKSIHHNEFEQFQRLNDQTKREQQETIRKLQEKIFDLERKTELQGIKHQEILLEFESLKTQRDRVLPALNGPMIENGTEMDDDSAPIHHPPSKTISSNNELRNAQIVKAKYIYEPLKSSPNDHPEIELPLKLGEFYLIYGDADEDGFYDGRNLDGRYGLIPSNFIEVISNGNDIPENIQHQIQKLTGKPLTRHERTATIDSDVFFNQQSIRTSSSSDLSSEDRSHGKHVPAPNHLRVEKVLSNSLLIAWDPPSTDLALLGYQILLDQSVYNTIRANERTRALIENVNTKEKAHRLSIRTMTQRGLSHAQDCTLVVNNTNEPSLAPTDLRVDRVLQTSALVSWWPVSNDLMHRLLINDIELQILQAGIYRFKFSGLVPNSIHKVTIKAKPPGISNYTPQQLSSSIEFRTTAFDESIEPPKRVQAVVGPQTNTLFVSWESVSPTAPIRGYRVFIDGRPVQDVATASSKINMNSRRHGRILTVRTVNEKGGESPDSMPIDLDQVTKKTLRPTPSISPDRSTAIGMQNPLLARTTLESPSTTSSTSTDIPQIELKPAVPSSAKTSPIGNKPNPRASLKKTNDAPRLFVALYDYDPNAMSPNPDSEEELPFKEGQTIKIYGEKDADGFYFGQTDNGRTGLVPSNMVSEIVSEPKLSPKLATKKKMVAMYDYNPAIHSPNANADDELSFQTGEVIYVYGDMQEDGYYEGELENGKRGFVPSNYLKEVPIVEKEEKPVETVLSPESKPLVESETTTTKSEAEKPKSGLFDRFKTTFSWNLNEPI